MALVVGVLVILALAFCLSLFGGIAIVMSTDSCPSELSSACGSRVEVAAVANLVLQAGAVGAAVWVSRSKLLLVAQRFLALGALALAQIVVTMAAGAWVTALW